MSKICNEETNDGYSCELMKGHSGLHRSASITREVVEWGYPHSIFVKGDICEAESGDFICHLEIGHNGPHRAMWIEKVEWEGE